LEYFAIIAIFELMSNSIAPEARLLEAVERGDYRERRDAAYHCQTGSVILVLLTDQ
jgi:hypothetical protein